ncbi:lytic transglycosylase domain-containing protein [Mesorhizobium sp. PL10]
MDMSLHRRKIVFLSHGRPSSSGRSRLFQATVLAIVVSAAMFSRSAIAEQTSRNNNALRPQTITESRSKAALDGFSDVFATRWPTASDAFILGSDGVVRAPNRPSVDPNPTMQGDSRLAKQEELQNWSKGSIEDTRIGGAGQETLALADNDCGPSAIAPEKIRAFVDDAAAKHGVDAVFAAAIAWSESGFDRSRNSSKGARGPMQLMPATALELGVEDICDAADNIDGGVRHLRALLDEFKNPLLAAAAYNAGAEPVYRYGGIPPYPETVSFVARVVNFTLGLKPPDPRARQANKQMSAAGAEAGVITEKKPGEFVGGVMQF